MKICTDLTGSTSYNQRFEVPTQKIGVNCNGVALNDMLNAFMTITMMSPNGQLITITPKTRIGDLLELAASNEGMTRFKKVASVFHILGTIELSNAGAISVEGGYFQVTIDGAVSTSKWTLYAMEDADLTDMVIMYSPIWCAQNQFKEIALNGAYAVAVPKAEVTELHLNYFSGRTVIFSPDELEMITIETNEICEFYQGFDAGITQGGSYVPGSNKFYVLGVTEVASVKLICSAASTVYVISDSKL